MILLAGTVIRFSNLEFVNEAYEKSLSVANVNQCCTGKSSNNNDRFQQKYYSALHKNPISRRICWHGWCSNRLLFLKKNECIISIFHIKLQDATLTRGESLVESMVPCAHIEPTDSNDLQTFPIDSNECIGGSRYLRITFGASTDFYGRVTVYQFLVCLFLLNYASMRNFIS